MRTNLAARFSAHFVRGSGHVLARLREILWRQFAVLCVAAVAFASAGKAEMTLVIVANEQPPVVSEGNPKDSFLTDVFREVGREMGVTFEFRFMPWKRCEESLENGEAWGAVPYVRTPERERKFYFSDPIFTSYTKLFYYSPSGPWDIKYSQLNDLRGLRIGAISGYYYVKLFSDAGLNVEYVDTEEQNIQKLKLGRVDVTPGSATSTPHLIRRLFPQDVNNFFTLEYLLHWNETHLMASKQYQHSEDLLFKFNASLRTIKQNGVLKKLISEHGIFVPH